MNCENWSEKRTEKCVENFEILMRALQIDDLESIIECINIKTAWTFSFHFWGINKMHEILCEKLLYRNFMTIQWKNSLWPSQNSQENAEKYEFSLN